MSTLGKGKDLAGLWESVGYFAEVRGTGSACFGSKLYEWMGCTGEVKARPRYRAWFVLRRMGWDIMIEDARKGGSGLLWKGSFRDWKVCSIDKPTRLARMKMGLD